MRPTSSAGAYDRIERAIRFLERNASRRPSLDETARAVGLSPYHFQRLFTRWAGVSPKRFLQYLTVENAKAVLEESRSLLDATYAMGLSSSSRLHDLFVTVDAVTPGEFRQGGSGLVIRHGVHPTPFGSCLLAETDRGIVRLEFLAGRDPQTALQVLRERWPGAELRDDPGGRRTIERIFDGRRGNGRPLRLHVRGTNFQLQVWQALLRVPPGALVTYEDVATRLGAPGAARAVGSALANNPVAYLIPCHRVIRRSGALGGYRWGATRKAAMVAWEAARTGAGVA